MQKQFQRGKNLFCMYNTRVGMRFVVLELKNVSIIRDSLILSVIAISQ